MRYEKRPPAATDPVAPKPSAAWLLLTALGGAATAAVMFRRNAPVQPTLYGVPKLGELEAIRTNEDEAKENVDRYRRKSRMAWGAGGLAALALLNLKVAFDHGQTVRVIIVASKLILPNTAFTRENLVAQLASSDKQDKPDKSKTPLARVDQALGFVALTKREADQQIMVEDLKPADPAKPASAAHPPASPKTP
jgi:hypothetical protein